MPSRPRPPDKQCPQCAKLVPGYNEECLWCGYEFSVRQQPEPEDDEPTGPVVVINYPGRTQADAASHYAAHASKMAALGYRPVAQSWAEGRPGVGRVLAIGVFASSIKPNGYLTVTYHKVESTSGETVPQDPFTTIRQLGMLRSEGLISDEEFEAKKAEILARL
jgi:hypothetical protein